MKKKTASHGGKSKNLRQIQSEDPFLLFRDENQEIWSKCVTNFEKVPKCAAGKKRLKTTALATLKLLYFNDLCL